MDNDRTDAARDHDDREIIERADATPAQSGASGGNLQRDIGARDEEHSSDTGGVTRVRDSDKPEEVDLPRYNQH